MRPCSHVLHFGLVRETASLQLKNSSSWQVTPHFKQAAFTFPFDRRVRRAFCRGGASD